MLYRYRQLYEKRLGGVPVKMLVWLGCCQQEASSWMLWARAQVSLFPMNFHKHLQHVSHIHNCTPGLVLLCCINNMHCKEKVYDYIFNG